MKLDKLEEQFKSTETNHEGALKAAQAKYKAVQSAKDAAVSKLGAFKKQSEVTEKNHDNAIKAEQEKTKAG